MRTMQFARADEGQAVVIVALAMVALMGALALTLDWGYAYVQRRGMQNAVDNATLAAGRHVASTFKLVSGTPAFDATLEDVCHDVATRTASLGGQTAISFFFDPADAGTWTTITTSACAAGAGVPVPSDTIFVRVRSTGTFRSITQQTIAVAASARARLTGTAGCDDIDCTALRPLALPQAEVPGHGVSGHTTSPNAAIWPLAVHLDLADFQGSPCGQFCDASVPANQIHLWDVVDADDYGPPGQRFTGLVTYTHFSPREFGAANDDGQVHQLNTESDYTGTTELAIRQAHGHDDGAIYPPAQMPDLGACPGNNWDTLGDDDLSDATSCDLPNWFAYGFRGSVGVGTDWDPTTGSWTGFVSAPGLADLPEPLPTGTTNRSSCDRSVYLARPSCAGGSNRIGDWIETVPGDLTTLMANQMKAFVAKYGRMVPHSFTPINASPGAPLLGRAAVVWVPLWDCAEHFNELANQGAPGRWTLITPAGGDCSQLVTSSTTVDRVHIVAIVPFTVYDGLIETSPPHVHGVWGDVFGDAGVCSEDPLAASCGLNQIMNSAFLVPDE